MTASDEVILDGVFEKIKRGMPISKEEWGMWANFTLGMNWGAVSSISAEEWAGMQVNFQNQLRRKFLGDK